MRCHVVFHDRSLTRFDWCRWPIVGQDGDNQLECGEAGVDELPGVTANCSQLFVFLPQQDILLANPLLPPKAGKQQLNAIAYTLEESLAQDIDDCFFALLPQQPDQHVPVAVIDRKIMDEVTALFHRQHLNPRALLPVLYLCPWSSDGGLLAVICPYHNGYLIRTSEHLGLFCDRSVVTPIVQRIAAGASDGLHKIEVYGDQPLVQSLQSELPENVFDIKALPAIQLASQDPDTTNSINLKQKDYQSNRQWAGLLKRWRWPAILLFLLLLVLAGGFVYDSWQKQQQLDQLIKQQQSLLKEQIPNLAVSDRAKDQLVQLLSSQSSGQGQAGFIELLYEFSRLKSGFDGLNINKIVYQKGQLVVNLEAKDLKLMEAFRSRLESARYPGEIDNVSINPDKTSGRLIMKGAQ